MAPPNRPRGTRARRAKAFAKINLSLRVLGVRRDGYHGLDTTFQSLALHDLLTVRERRGPFELLCNDPGCPADGRNLVWRAAERMWRLAGRRGAIEGLRIRLTKRIPMQAGLGGGSSDAAATIRALADLWRVDITSPGVARIARGLGADVPFFLLGGTARGLARGDRLRPLPDHPRRWVLLVMPSIGVSTPEAYRWLDEERRAGGARGSAGNRDSPAINDLQGPVVRRHPEIGRIVKALGRLGAADVAMSGSGSAVFGLFASRAAAAAAAAAVASRSRRTLITRTLDRAGFEVGVVPRPVRPR